MHAPAAGRAVAELVTLGGCRTFDLRPLRPARFAEGDLVRDGGVVKITMIRWYESFFTVASAPRLWFLVVLDRSRGRPSVTAEAAAAEHRRRLRGQAGAGRRAPDDAAVSEAYCRAALRRVPGRLLGRVHEAQEGQDRRLAADLNDGHVQALAAIGFKLDPVETALFRVAQQALANVVDHAEAAHVLVAVERRRPGRVEVGA